MQNFSTPGGRAAVHSARRAESHRQAGLRAQRAQRWDTAEHEFELAAGLAPADALMWLNLARSRLQLNKHVDALAAAQRAFELDRASLPACRFAAELLLQMNRPAEALATLEALAPEVARDHEFHNDHGNALFQVKRPRDAVDAFFRALALKVDAAIVHYRLGLCFMDMAMAHEASECFRTTISLDDGAVRALALSLIVHESRQACNWTNAEADTRALLDAVDGDDPEVGRLLSPFALLAIDATPAQQRRMGERRLAGLTRRVVPLPRPGRRKPGRIRVGYLSADFHQHATAVLMTELLERRDTERFEVFLYSHGPADDTELCRRVRAACEHFVDVSEMGNRAVALRMREDGIDIAIDLKGHTRDSRMDLLAYRPAPVQASYLGYPASSGAAFIDYFIGDRITTPLSHAANYSEHIAQLSGCYQPNDAARALPPQPPRSELGLPEDAVVLCCFNQTYKLSPHMLDLWARILAGAPRTVLWMLAWNPHARENLLRELAARGVPAGRVVFAPKLAHNQHLERYVHADLFLDTSPYNAHTTGSDAMRAHVPILTVRGSTFASRVAQSLLYAVGVPELVTENLSAYTEAAIRLAGDHSELRQFRQRIAEGVRSGTLFDTRRFAKGIEAAYCHMYVRASSGRRPCQFTVQPDGCILEHETR